MFAIEWPLFFMLLGGGLLGAAAVLPYAVALTHSSDVQALRQKARLPEPVLYLISVLQTGVLIAISAFVGLLAARQVGLSFPILQAILQGQPVGDQLLNLLPVVLLGCVVAGGLMLLLELGIFGPRTPVELSSSDGRISFWKRVLACFYGMIDEEILIRMLFMGGLAWLIGLVWKSASGLPADGAFWLAIVLSAVIFGLGHLPATSRITPLTPLVIARAVALNGIPGIVFGYLYWQYGLVAAMLAHFLLDLLIHLGAPAIAKSKAQIS